MLTELQLRAFLPALPNPDMWAVAVNEACARFGIDTASRLTAFLGQCAHESAGFTRLVENLNYSAERMMQVWPRRFPVLATTRPYAHQPEKLGNLVYANRLGNGPEESGDGYRFRGRGLIQLTGRAAYRLAGLALQLPLETEPSRVGDPGPAALTAAQFWNSRNLNPLADTGLVADFDRISRKINGGEHGLLDRRAQWDKAKTALATPEGL